MSIKHAVFLIGYSVLFFGGPIIAALTVDVAILFFLSVSVFLTLGITGRYWVEDDFYFLPLTHKMRLLNRQQTHLIQAKELSEKANQCYELARTYRSRNQLYDAEILGVESDHKKRQSELEYDKAYSIQMEMEDKEMLSLLGRDK
jgi:hypothetical protein